MTYLEAVNHVLRRLREEEVSSVNDNAYSKMVGDFVNDAKQLVEAAWDWSGLRRTITVTTTDGIFDYTLTTSQNTIKILNAFNDTTDVVLKYQTPQWFDDKYLMSDVVSGAPEYYVFNGLNSAGDTNVDLYPKPDGVYLLRFNCVLRNPVMSADTDELIIPSQPVIHMAVALLARERGETGGTSAAEYFSIADTFLADAIALDAQKHPEETIWYTP
jgi:hypothetical protein